MAQVHSRRLVSDLMIRNECRQSEVLFAMIEAPMYHAQRKNHDGKAILRALMTERRNKRRCREVGLPLRENW